MKGGRVLSKSVKILIGIFLTLSIMLTSIGYAELSDSLSIVGVASATPPEAVYITSVTTNGASGGKAEVNGFSMTVVNSKVTLANRRSSTATFTITVYNNSNVVQGFNAIVYSVGETTYDNDNISLTPSIERRTTVNPGEYLTFTVTAAYVNKENRDNTVLNSIVNYEFLPIEEIPEDEGGVAALNVLEKFKQILNTPADYKILSDEIAANYDGSRAWTATYIGNVQGTEDYEGNNDTAIVNDLFDGVLNLNINGTDTNVTVIIKRESLDNNANTGDTYYYGNPAVGVEDTEMTLYITAEDLRSVSSGKNVTVYAFTFTIDQDAEGNTTGQWYQIGGMYVGTASVVGYIGGYSNGSFDTGTWISTTSYHGIPFGATLATLIQAAASEK